MNIKIRIYLYSVKFVVSKEKMQNSSIYYVFLIKNDLSASKKKKKEKSNFMISFVTENDLST